MTLPLWFDPSLCLIGGKWVPAQNGRTLSLINPSNNTALADIAHGQSGDIDAAVFEVSVPSLGTGIEMAHAYLRPRLGLPEIPILALYEKDFWPNNLSSMVRGLSSGLYPNFVVKEYEDLEEACHHTGQFITSIERKMPG